MERKRIIRFIKKYIFACISCVYIFTFGLLSVKNRAFLTEICKHFGYHPKLFEPIIPQISLSDVVSEHAFIQLREVIARDGNVSILELLVLTKLIVQYHPIRLFEIGTFDGRTTLNMAANSSSEAKIYTLDLPRKQINSTRLNLDIDDKAYIDKEQSGSRYVNTDCESKIFPLYGDSAVFDFSPFYNSIDFIFLDGSHAHDYVINDSKLALKLLRNGKGIILWHDYDGWEGVTSALNELYKQHPAFASIRRIEGTSLVCLISD